MMFNNLPKKVRIVEVGARDGLQNESKVIQTADKLKYIQLLALTGLQTIEATSFVSPKSIAQMHDSEELFKQIKTAGLVDKVSLPCLVPNLKGFETALKVGVQEIALFTATSDAFTKKNINASVDDSFIRMREVVQKAQQEKIKIRGYVSTAFGCPYAGEIGVAKLIEVTKRLFDLGVYEVSIGDTIGVANPKQVDNYLTELKKHFDFNKLAMHFHDTRSMALSNILVALTHGIGIYDSSSGGLGGCPYARGATGNVATEDICYLFESLGIETGIDFERLAEASQYILNVLGKETTSKVLAAYLKGK